MMLSVVSCCLQHQCPELLMIFKKIRTSMDGEWKKNFVVTSLSLSLSLSSSLFSCSFLSSLFLKHFWLTLLCICCCSICCFLFSFFFLFFQYRPSFRPDEIHLKNFNQTTWNNGDHVYSNCGTHLGSFLPDITPQYPTGDRWCMDVSCLSGNPMWTKVKGPLNYTFPASPCPSCCPSCFAWVWGDDDDK